MNYQGYIIYRERLRRNWSQAGLCKGICTVSYLSKIESGKAEPSEEIVRLLLDRLDLEIDQEIEREAAKLADQGWELLFGSGAAFFRKAFGYCTGTMHGYTAIGSATDITRAEN